MSEREARHYSVQFDCDYLLEAPVGNAEQAIVTLHGYGQNPEVMLRFTRDIVGTGFWIASLRAPHPFTLKPLTPGSDVGYNWGAPGADWERSKELHHRLVLAAIADLQRASGVPASRIVLAGFSQPVGLNYRFIRAHPDAVRGVIGFCGGVPKDWEDLPLPRAKSAILHIARSEDEFYPAEKSLAFEDRLRSRSDAPVELHMLPGTHRFPSKAGGIVSDWLGRVLS